MRYLRMCSWNSQRMLPFAALLTLMLTTPNLAAAADQACYKFENQTGHSVTLHFEYPGGVLPQGNALIDQSVAPKASFTYCVNPPVEVGAYVSVGPAGAVASWNGPRLVAGTGTQAHPAGNYTIRDQPPPPVTRRLLPGEKEIYEVHSYSRPGAKQYPWGSSCAGTQDFIHIKIRCKANDRHWSLTCKADGSLCNHNEYEFCNGLTQWNIQEHCTKPDGKANGW